MYIPVEYNTPKENSQLVLDLLKYLNVDRLRSVPVLMSSNESRDLARRKPYDLYAFTLEEVVDRELSEEAIIVEPSEA